MGAEDATHDQGMCRASAEQICVSPVGQIHLSWASLLPNHNISRLNRICKQLIYNVYVAELV